jgi:hypothetical protein
MYHDYNSSVSLRFSLIRIPPDKRDYRNVAQFGLSRKSHIPIRGFHERWPEVVPGELVARDTESTAVLGGEE